MFSLALRPVQQPYMHLKVSSQRRWCRWIEWISKAKGENVGHGCHETPSLVPVLARYTLLILSTQRYHSSMLGLFQRRMQDPDTIASYAPQQQHHNHGPR